MTDTPPSWTKRQLESALDFTFHRLSCSQPFVDGAILTQLAESKADLGSGQREASDIGQGNEVVIDTHRCLSMNNKLHLIACLLLESKSPAARSSCIVHHI